MLSYRPGTTNDFQCGLNQFFNIENRKLIVYWKRKKTNECIYSPFPGHEEYEQNHGNLKGKLILKTEGGKEES